MNAFVCVALTAYIESPVSVFIPPPLPVTLPEHPKPVKPSLGVRPSKKTPKKLSKADRVRIHNAQYEKKKAAVQLDLLDKSKVS